jgi:hypothetical protein
MIRRSAGSIIEPVTQQRRAHSLDLTLVQTWVEIAMNQIRKTHA